MSRPNGVSEDCVAEVWTQGNGLQRTGLYLCERSLKPALINADSFGRIATMDLDGHVYAQILYLPRRHYDLNRDVAFVATMRNTVYCIDVTNAFQPTIIWQHNVGPYVPVQDVYGWSYRDIYEALGILATPLIDRTTNRIYLTSHQLSDGKVSHHIHGQNTTHNKQAARDTWPELEFNLTCRSLSPVCVCLSALNIYSGAEELSNRVEGGVPGNGAGSKDGWLDYNPYFNLQRTGLAMSNNYVVIAMGSVADLHPFHGWMFAFHKETLNRVGVFCTTPNTEGGGMWQSSGGLVVQVTTNRILAVTGNGYYADPSKGEYVQSVLSMSVSDNGLKVEDWGAPSQWDRWSGDDADMCTACALVPGTNRCILGSKDAHMYLFRTDWLGNVQSNPADAQMQIVDVAETPGGADAQNPKARSHVHGQPIVWWPEGKDRRIYVGPERSHLQVYEFRDFTGDPGSGHIDPTPIMMSNVTAEPASMPGWILSLCADQGKDGILVSSMVRPAGGDANGFITGGIVRLFDALTLQELWNSEMRDQDDVFDFAKFNQLTIADGMIFVPTFGDRASKKPGAFHILGYRNRTVDRTPYTPPPPPPPPPAVNGSTGADDSTTGSNSGPTDLVSSGPDSIPVDTASGSLVDGSSGGDLALSDGTNSLGVPENAASMASPMGLPMLLMMWMLIVMLARRWTH